MNESRQTHAPDRADIERSNPMLMRVLAGILSVLILLGVVISLTSDSGWQAYSDSLVGIIFAYFCIAYTLGSADPLGQLYRKIIR